MPRTRYTRLVHDIDEGLLNQQLRALHRLAWALRHHSADVVELSLISDQKAHRRTRLNERWNRKIMSTGDRQLVTDKS